MVFIEKFSLPGVGEKNPEAPGKHAEHGHGHEKDKDFHRIVPSGQVDTSRRSQRNRQVSKWYDDGKNRDTRCYTKQEMSYCLIHG